MTDLELTELRNKYEQVLKQTMERLLELDALSIEERARITYSVGSVNYDWNSYRSILLEQIKSVEEVLKNLQKLSPIFIRYVVM